MVDAKDEPEDHEDADESETIPCPACGAAIYEDSPHCPRCGEYVVAGGRQGPSGLIAAGVIVGLIVVSYWILGR